MLVACFNAGLVCFSWARHLCYNIHLKQFVGVQQSQEEQLVHKYIKQSIKLYGGI
jgi:hypothetical protein